jgi:hypothetical protein
MANGGNVKSARKRAKPTSRANGPEHAAQRAGLALEAAPTRGAHHQPAQRRDRAEQQAVRVDGVRLRAEAAPLREPERHVDLVGGDRREEDLAEADGSDQVLAAPEEDEEHTRRDERLARARVRVERAAGRMCGRGLAHVTP